MPKSHKHLGGLTQHTDVVSLALWGCTCMPSFSLAPKHKGCSMTQDRQVVAKERQTLQLGF